MASAGLSGSADKRAPGNTQSLRRRTQLIGRAQLRQSFFDIDLSQQNRAQIVVRRRVFGIQFQGLSVELNCFRPVFSLGSFESLRAIITSCLGCCSGAREEQRRDA